jgi:hypothetical protein
MLIAIREMEKHPRYEAVLKHQRELFYAKLSELQESHQYSGLPNHVIQCIKTMYITNKKIECPICLER